MKTDNSDRRKTDNSDLYMVGWLCALAQQYLSLVKTETSFAVIDTVEDTEFILLKTSIVNKQDIDLKDLDSPIGLKFYVEIAQVSLSDSLHTQLILWFRDQKNKLLNLLPKKRKPKSIIRHMSEKDFSMMLSLGSNYKSNIKFWKPKHTVINTPIVLRFELMESLPCGISQFAITTVDSGSWDINTTEIVNLFSKEIFDELHLFFHEHHYHEHRINGNSPLISTFPLDIISIDNPCIVHFIDSLASDLANKENELYRSCRDLITRWKGVKKGEKKLSKKLFKEACHNLYNDCDNLLGIHAFVTPILYSPQNRSRVLNGEINSDEGGRGREIAAMIEAAFKGTNTLMQKISHLHGIFNTRQSMRAAFIGIFISVAFGAISVFLTILLEYENLGRIWESFSESFSAWLTNLFS